MRQIQLLYFARIREALATESETLGLPAEVGTVAELIAWLAARGGAWAEVFAGKQVFRVAINQEVVAKGCAIPAGAEVAIFPPVTGG